MFKLYRVEPEAVQFACPYLIEPHEYQSIGFRGLCLILKVYWLISDLTVPVSSFLKVSLRIEPPKLTDCEKAVQTEYQTHASPENAANIFPSEVC